VIGLSEITEIWTPHGYVESFEKWKNLDAQKSSEKLWYPAYVQPINQEPYGTLLSKHGHVFGDCEKPTNDDCGQIFRKIQCSQNAMHHPSFRHIRCNEPGCPVCYVKFSSRTADRVTERVQGYKTVYRNEKVYHLIFWGARADRPYADLRAAFKEAKILLGVMGAVSAVVWYHPYRIRAELKAILRRYRRANGLDGRAGFWKLAHDDVLGLGGLERYIVYAPHWHAIAAGWLIPSDQFNEITEGAGYKKKRYLDKEKEVHEVAHYISTHAAMEWGKSSVRYYGKISYRMLAREMVEEKIKDVVCHDCGAALEEYDCDDTGVIAQKLKDSITEKIKYYLYWKKGQPKPDMLNAHQCLVSRFCRE
jgi:hypothetical protein